MKRPASVLVPEVESTPKRRARNEPSKLHDVHTIANGSLIPYLDLRSLANLQASSAALRRQYGPGPARFAWLQRRLVNPAAELASVNMTVVGARSLHELYKFKPNEVREAAPHIFAAAVVNGNLELVRWYCETFGVAGLINPSSGNLLVILTDILLGACRSGHMELVAWLINYFGMEMSKRGEWGALMRAAIKNGSRAMMEFVYKNRPDHVATTRFIQRARLSELANAQNATMWHLCAEREEDVMWAIDLFGYSKERICELIRGCIALRQDSVVRRLLLGAAPLGRGPVACYLRELFERGYSEVYGEFPPEPADSVFDPNTALDTLLMPPVDPDDNDRETYAPYRTGTLTP